MTIKDCIDIIDNLKPNQYTIKEKVSWLSFIEEIIINDVLKTHEGYDGRYDDFTGYTADKLSVALIVPSPYDRLYTAYLKMKIDEENGETTRYNNSAALFNTYMSEYRKYYNKTHMPLDVTRKNPNPMQKGNTFQIPDAVIENIKRELSAIMNEKILEQISDDKIYDVIMRYVQNNVQLLKGKDGYTPIKGMDYFTDEDIINLLNHIQVENIIGKILPPAGSEVFNDYENNDTNIPYAHIEGRNNKAIIKCFKIVNTSNIENGVLGLDSVEGIEVGMVWNIFTDEESPYKRHRGHIKSVNKENNTVTADVNGVEGDADFPAIVADNLNKTGFLYSFMVHGGTIGTHTIDDNELKLFSTHIDGECGTGYLDTHTTGFGCQALGYCSDAGGYKTIARGDRGKTSGYMSEANGHESEAGGNRCIANAYASQANGYLTVVRENALGATALGFRTIAAANHQFVHGALNIEDTDGLYYEIIGNGYHDVNGTGEWIRRNARTLDRDGNAWFAGEVEDGQGNKLSNKADKSYVRTYVNDALGDIETALDNIIAIQNELLGVSE